MCTASFAVAATGELFTWGNGWAGKLGHSDISDQLSPRRVEALICKCVVAVATGSAHTLVVKRGGSVFVWGSAAGLSLPEYADGSEHVQVHVQGAAGILSSRRYPQLVSERSV